MAEVKALQKENQELKNEVGKLSKEFKELNVQLSKVPKPHAQTSKFEQEKSIEFLSKQYDDLISANEEVKKVLKRTQID